MQGLSSFLAIPLNMLLIFQGASVGHAADRGEAAPAQTNAAATEAVKSSGVLSKAQRTAADRLLAAYPQHLARVEENELIWKDGTRMLIDDGRSEKPFEQWLSSPDIKDMFIYDYTTSWPAQPPAVNFDPGRARHAPLFDKMYGDCTKGQVTGELVDVVWLPRKAGQKLKISRINGVADRLRAVSDELDKLPSRFDRYLHPSAGTYNCRTIAGTNRISAHGHGISIDLALADSHYWRWTKPDAKGDYKYKNSIPREIVEAFERNGFIRGGRWHHYDTMHFEYRPELLPRARGKKPS